MGSIGDLSPGGSLAIGIIVGLVSTSVQSLGITLQRKSHILEDEKGPHDIRRPPHRRRRWQLGMGMFIAANVLGSTVQISTLPLPVLSTLQASGLVFNSICATLILGEPFTRWSMWGTMLVCSGAVLIGIFGAIPAPAHNLEELLALLGRTPFVVWMSLQAVLVIAMAAVVDSVNHLSSLAQNARFRLVRGLAYGCISGILSAHSLLVAKSAVELVIKTVSGGSNQFVYWQSWMLLVALVALALTQLYYLHRGLKLVSTSVLYPLVFCIYNIIAILDGLIYFDQVNLLSLRSALLISLGTVILLSGVLALSWRLSDEQHPPAVGQSTLAPGLGLVEDTDGEEDEEDGLLLGCDIADEDDEDNVLPTHYTYQTFGPNRTPLAGADERPTSMTPTRKRSLHASASASAKRTSWAERVEIWGDLEDQHESRPLPSPGFGRLRSHTLPNLGGSHHGGGGESAALLSSSRRNVSSSSGLGLGSGGSSFGLDGVAERGMADGAGGANASVDALTSQPRRFRRRRKSTGFPGFQARRTRRKSSGGLQDAIGGLWRMSWWKRTGSGSNDTNNNKNNNNKGKAPAGAGAGPGSSGGEGTSDGTSHWPPYRDHPEDDGGPDIGPSGGGGGTGGAAGGGAGGAGGSGRKRNGDDSPV